MPSNWLYIDTHFPTFTGEETTEEKVVTIQNYMFMLVEQLRYSLHNLDLSNMNGTAVNRFVSSIEEPIYGRIEDAEGNLSQLELTAYSMSLRMLDAEGNISTLEQRATSVESTVAKQGVSITTLQQTATGIQSNVTDLQTGMSQTVRLAADGMTITNASGSALTIDGGQIDAENLNLTGRITFGCLSNSVQNDINDAYSMAEDAEATAADAAAIVNEITYTYNGTTYIDENCIMAGTVIAGHLMGGTVELLDADEYVQGYITITDAETADYAIEIQSNGAMRLLADGEYAALYMEAGDAASLAIRTISSYGYHIVTNRPIVPASDGSCYVGTSYRAFAGIYTETDPVVTSDRKAKNDIKYGLDDLEGFFDGLQASSYMLVKGTSGRRHNGFVAQDVKKNLEKHGIDTKDFAGYVESTDDEGVTHAGLRYGEFIPMTVEQVQKVKRKQKTMDGRLEKVEKLLEKLLKNGQEER